MLMMCGAMTGQASRHSVQCSVLRKKNLGTLLEVASRLVYMNMKENEHALGTWVMVMIPIPFPLFN